MKELKWTVKCENVWCAFFWSISIDFWTFWNKMSLITLLISISEINHFKRRGYLNAWVVLKKNIAFTKKFRWNNGLSSIDWFGSMFRMPTSDGFSEWLFPITVSRDYFGCLFQMTLPDDCFRLLFQMTISGACFRLLFRMTVRIIIVRTIVYFG